MKVQKSNQSRNVPDASDFSEFWKNFQTLPFKWAERFITQSRYLLMTTAIVYLFFAFMTFFPTISGISPEIIKEHPLFEQFSTKVLTDYPSLNIIFLGWVFVILLSVQWRHKIPSFFQWLWENQRLGPKSEDLKREYESFLQGYQKTLLEKKNPLFISIGLMSLFALLLSALRYPQLFYLIFSTIGTLLIFSIIIIAFFWIFLIGLVVWLIITTCVYIGKLSQSFSIQIQPSHPDKCGGLKPLGDFCISTLMPLIVGGFFLTLIPILRLDASFDVWAIMSTFALFLVAGPLTFLTIYLALWNVHNEMVEHKRVYADKIAGQIIFLETEIFLNTKEDGDLLKAKIAKEKIEILQTLNPDKISYPVWPFKVVNTAILVFSPQILQTFAGVSTTIYNLFFK